jgi:DNA polymerase-3 subunit delta
LGPEISPEDRLKKIKRYYLFYGPNGYWLDERVSSLVKVAISAGAEAFDLDRFEGKACDITQVINAISTPPVISPLRVVILANVDHLSAAGQARLESLLSRIPEYSVLAMVAAKMDRRSKLFKRLASEEKGKADEGNAHTYYHDVYSPGEAVAIIEGFAAELGKKISSAAALGLAETFGSDPYRLKNEVDKISLYAGDKKEIDKKDLAFASGFDRVETVDDLPGLILDDKRDQALALIGRAMASGISEFQILFILRNFLWGLNAAATSKNIGQLMSMMRMSQDRARDLFKRSKVVSQEAVAMGLTYIFRAEFSLKSARFSSEGVMELLVMSLCLVFGGNIPRSRLYLV